MDNKIVVAPLRAKITKIVATAQEIVIKTAEDMTLAVDVLGKIKSWTKEVESARKKITDPLNESLKAARALFSPLEENGKEAEKIVKQKMIAYQIAEEVKAKLLAEKIEAKVEEGLISFERGMSRLENSEPEARVEGNKFALTFRETRTIEITNEKLIPRAYLVPDMVSIRRDALAGKEISGVRVIVVMTPVSSSVLN